MDPMNIEKLLLPNLKDQIDIHDTLFIADMTRHPIKLFHVRHKDYDSIVCRRMMVSVKLEDLVGDNNIFFDGDDAEYLTDIQNVLVMKKELLMIPKNIENASDFLHALTVADKLCLDVNRVCRYKNIAWLGCKLQKIKDQYIKSQKLFTPIEAPVFRRHKFINRDDDPNDNRAVGYPGQEPQNTTSVIKMKIADIDKTHDIETLIQIVHMLTECMNLHGMDHNSAPAKIINKIIIMAFTDMKKYPSAYATKFLLTIPHRQCLIY